ncbi:MAG: hypothetical protein A2173_04065 [Planctomycetes bacterium RBG_13_44_8b]|nr:MAG: hypothetical protein A2173_04065 [Planctomycetes bacterium RBG_13_44_8b]
MGLQNTHNEQESQENLFEIIVSSFIGNYLSVFQQCLKYLRITKNSKSYRKLHVEANRDMQKNSFYQIL